MTEDIDQFTWRLLAPCAARHRNGGGPATRASSARATAGRRRHLESLPALWVLFGLTRRIIRRAPRTFDAFPLSVRWPRLASVSTRHRRVNTQAKVTAEKAAPARPTPMLPSSGSYGGRRRARRLRAFTPQRFAPVRRRRALGRLAPPRPALGARGPGRCSDLAQARLNAPPSSRRS